MSIKNKVRNYILDKIETECCCQTRIPLWYNTINKSYNQILDEVLYIIWRTIYDI